jgi:hypothetical protein
LRARSQVQSRRRIDSGAADARHANIAEISRGISIRRHLRTLAEERESITRHVVRKEDLNSAENPKAGIVGIPGGSPVRFRGLLELCAGIVLRRRAVASKDS